MSIINKLKSEGVLKFYADYRSGQLNDLVSGLTPTVNSATLSKAGLITPSGSNTIQYTDDDFTQSELTVVWLGRYNKTGHPLNYNELGCIDSVATREFRVTTSGTQLYFSTTTVTGVSVAGKKYIACSWKSGEAGEFYLDGIGMGGTTAYTNTDATTTLSVNGYKTGGNYNNENYCDAFLYFSRKLTATEHAELFAELEAMKFPSKTFAKAKGNAVKNSTFKELGAGGTEVFSNWTNTSTAGVTFSQSGNACRMVSDGTFCSITQPVCNVGEQYKCRFTITNVTSGAIRINNDAGANTYSAVGEYELTFTANSANFGIKRSSGATDVTFTDVELERAVLWKADWGTSVSLANETAYPLSDTPFDITGTYKIVSDTIDGTTIKAIKNITIGNIVAPTSILGQTPTEALHGKWEFWMKLVSPYTSPTYFTLSEVNNPDITAGTNYNITFNQSNGLVGLRRDATYLTTDTGFYSADEWFKVTWTISPAGVMKVYINDVLAASATDTTYTTAKYFGWRILTADSMVAWSDPTGNKSVIKSLTI